MVMLRLLRRGMRLLLREFRIGLMTSEGIAISLAILGGGFSSFASLKMIHVILP